MRALARTAVVLGTVGALCLSALPASAATGETPSRWGFPAWAFEPGANAVDQSMRDRHAAAWWNTFTGQGAYSSSGEVVSTRPGSGGAVTPTTNLPGDQLARYRGQVIQGQVLNTRTMVDPLGKSGNLIAGAADLSGLAQYGGTALTGASLGFGVTTTAMQLFGVDPAATGLSGLSQIVGVPPDADFVPNRDVPTVDGRIQPQALTVSTYTATSYPDRVPLTWIAGEPEVQVNGAYSSLFLTFAPQTLCTGGFSSGCSGRAMWGAVAVYSDGVRYAANADYDTVVPPGGSLPGSSFVNPMRSYETVRVSTTAQVDPRHGTPVRWEVYAIGDEQTPADAVGPLVIDLNAPDVVPNPERTWRTTWTCGGSPAGPLDSPTFTQDDDQYPAPMMGTCPATAALDSALIQLVTLDGSAPPVTVLEWAGPGPGLQRVREEFPECADGSCYADLVRTFPDGTTASCFDQPAACSDWFTDPDRDTKYECQFGGRPIELAGCQMYAPTFDAGKTEAGVYYADPHTGTEPATGITGAPNPSPDVATTPAVDTPTTPAPSDPDDGTEGGCRSASAGIFAGVTCALRDAFVPSTPMSQLVAPLTTAVQLRPPFSWFKDLQGSLPSPAGLVPGSCPDWSVQVGGWTSEDVTCDSAFNQLLHSSRPLTLGLMVVAAFAPLLRSVWYASIPFVKVTPTK